ncbi:MAG: hypothetical protein N3D15_04640 [Syntrophorhabdaceae bacterium]|nr:hypothetical protein [Syntrophorhabdaceae bacterium]
MAKVVSDKSTKTEILEAYNELIAKMKEQKAMDAKVIKKETEEKEIVKTASMSSIEDIVKRLAGLKLDIVNAMDGLEKLLIDEFKKLSDLKKATEIENRNLEELYQIKAEAESLTALIFAQKEKKAAFEEELARKKAEFDDEMTQKKLEWKKEQERYEQEKKEREAQLKKERQREEEEYNYNLKLARKKDADAYEMKKAALEKELAEKKAAFEKEFAERESILSAREKEYEDMKAKVEAFQSELARAIKDTEKSITERLEFKYKHQTELLMKEVEGERKLNQQIISVLEKKIKEQEELIRQLTEKANEAGRQVQDIAIKAIEGASVQRIQIEREKVKE